MEEDGFEPSVPRKMGYRFETAFVASVTVPIAEKGLTSSHPGAEGLNPHSLSRCPHESHSCKSSPAPSHVLARTNQNDGSGIMPLPHLGCRSAAASECYNQTWYVGRDPTIDGSGHD